MRIMYLLFSFTVGGTEKLVIDICNEMSKRSHEVFLYIVNDNYDEQILCELSEKVIIIKKNRQVGSGRLLRQAIDLFEFCKKEKIEVIHCNSFDIPEIAILCRMFLRNIKIVYTIHGVGQYDNLNKVRIIYRNVICNSIIAISRSVGDDIISHGANQKKVHVIYNAINFDKFEKHFNKRYDKDNIAIGHVGRIDIEKKGQDLLVEAIAILKKRGINIKCYFAGAADFLHQNDLKKLNALVDKYGLNESIIFCGNVENIPRFLEKIDIFVLPSRYEGFGISLIEAMAMGIPCIASNIAGPKEIIGDEEWGSLFDSGDPLALVDKIEHVIGNYDAQKARAEDVREHVIKHFNIQNMCDCLMKMYDK